MNFVTIEKLNSVILKKLYLIPETVDIVVGIPRSGMLVASLIALYRNLPLSDIDSFVNGDMYSCGITKKDEEWIDNISDARTILVVEDSSYTGGSIIEAKQKIQKSPYKNKVIFLSAIVTKEAKQDVDIYFLVLQPPRVFEWNMFHHQLVSNMCFDLDGVLCEDPTDEQNDDGAKYVDFVLNAPLKVKPTFEVGYIITSRLEKYRDITEQWLSNHGIHYKNLIMMQYKTKEERVKSGSHGRFKGDKYKKLSDTNLFIESNPGQAAEIASISGKTVYCTGNSKVYKDSFVQHCYEAVRFSGKPTIKQRISKVLPKWLKKPLKRINRLFRKA